MINRKALFDRLSGLRFRSRSRKTSQVKARKVHHRPELSAEVLVLEDRCLMSTTTVGGGHRRQGAPLAPTGSDIINFAGYQWYTNYHYNTDSGYHQNGQQWAPQNASVQNGQLHLELKTATVGNRYSALSSSEVVLVNNSAGQPFNPGYGTYLVSAQTNGSFSRLASNNGAIFGAFTYENLKGVGQIDKNKITGLAPSVVATLKPGMSVTSQNYLGHDQFLKGETIKEIQGNTVILNRNAIGSGEHTIYFEDRSLANGHRELDLMEASRFGIQNDPNDGQFTLQPHGANPKNVHRFEMHDGGQITLVMKWTGAEQPVTFSQYNGTYNLANLPATPNYSWTTPPQLDKYIPNSSLQTFHLNLWRANWKNPPDPRPDEVTVTNFQYVPTA
jgi:hypothetical protein